MSKSKVNTNRFESLECRNCNRCTSIILKKCYNNMYGTGYCYLITCDDGYIRMCETGSPTPSDCLKWEENIDKFIDERDGEK
jgi:hypothetical protein